MTWTRQPCYNWELVKNSQFQNPPKKGGYRRRGNMNATFEVKGIQVRHQLVKDADYISLTDLAKYKSQEPNKVIEHWMRNRGTFDYMAVWETLYNPNFNGERLNEMRMDSSTNTFMLSPQRWVEETNAIGIFSKAGKGGGTYAHKDIAFKFASWLSVEFELYVIKEFQRLKADEQKQLEWNAKRELSKINYRIQTDAIKMNLVVPKLTPQQIGFVYADEADRLNVALFGHTAAGWRKANPTLEGNVRDYASVHQLLVLANMESYNAEMIKKGVKAEERTANLNDMARYQLPLLMQSSSPLLLEEKKN